MSIALEIVRLRAREREHDQIQRLSAAWDDIAQAHGENLVSACGVFANAIVKWRSGATAADIDDSLSVARTLTKAD